MENQEPKIAQKKNSQGIIIALVVIVIIIIVAVVYHYSNISTKPGVKFTDTPEAKSAYLISTDTYDATTTLALIGFKVTKSALADGSVQIKLTAQNTEYKDQTYVVKSGEKLYFIEKFLQDDQNGEEKNLKDDTAILVDTDGYVVGN